MKNLLLIITILTVICVPVSAQKLTEPKLLGNWTYGEDPSEFLLHRVLEYSVELLNENPEGKLIVVICGQDNFSISFIKTQLSPFEALRYNLYSNGNLFPNEKMFIANSAKCSATKKFVFNQYWFVPGENTLDYDEIFSVNSISYKNLEVFESDYSIGNSEKKTPAEMNKEFAENVTKFINYLKDNPNADGFIVHNSKNKAMKRNIEKVQVVLKKENINSERVKTIRKPLLISDKNQKLIEFKDDKQSFPALKVISITR